MPADWIARASTDLGVPLAVLGASVQVVGGVSVGGATLGVPVELSGRACRDVAARATGCRHAPTPTTAIAVESLEGVA